MSKHWQTTFSVLLVLPVTLVVRFFWLKKLFRCLRFTRCFANTCMGRLPAAFMKPAWVMSILVVKPMCFHRPIRTGNLMKFLLSVTIWYSIHLPSGGTLKIGLWKQAVPVACVLTRSVRRRKAVYMTRAHKTPDWVFRVRHLSLMPVKVFRDFIFIACASKTQTRLQLHLLLLKNNLAAFLIK